MPIVMNLIKGDVMDLFDQEDLVPKLEVDYRMRKFFLMMLTYLEWSLNTKDYNLSKI